MHYNALITNDIVSLNSWYFFVDCAVCPERSVGLVRYPATLAPASGSTLVTTQCADNTRRISSSLSVSCTSTGTWSGVPQCFCNPGYREVTVSGRQICQGLHDTIHQL